MSLGWLTICFLLAAAQGLFLLLAFSGARALGQAANIPLRLLLGSLVLSLLLRGAFILAGFGLDDPWHYRFFPTELALFLFGALSHQFLMPFLMQKGWITRVSASWVTGAMLLYCASYFLLPWPAFHRLAIMAVFVLSLPFLFQFQRYFRLDRKIGELSYPIYITHMAIVVPVGFVFDRWNNILGYRGLDETLVVLTLTLVASLILNHLVSNRIEALRARVRGRPRVGSESRSRQGAQTIQTGELQSKA